jgi:hypothetical protein
MLQVAHFLATLAWTPPKETATLDRNRANQWLVIERGIFMRIKLFGGACLAAATVLLAGPVLAAPSGTLQGGYDYSTGSVLGQSFHTNGGNVSGNVDLPLNANWTVQADASYQGQSATASGGGGSIDSHVTDGALSAFYSAHMGRIGVLVGEGGFNESFGGGGGSANFNATYYGLFGDWYAGDHLTVSARGGGVSASNGLGTSQFYGGRVTGYLSHDIALYGTVDYAAFHGTDVTATNAGIGGEWLISHHTPFALTAAWTNSQVKEFGVSINSNVFSIGGKFYFGAGGSLRDRQRDGAETWGATSPIRTFLLF